MLAIEAQDNMTAAYTSAQVLELTAGSEPVEGSPTGSGNAIANMVAFLLGLGMNTGKDRFLQFLHEKIGAETNGQSLGITCSDSVSGGTVVYLRTIACDLEGEEVLCNIRYPISCDGEQLFAKLEQLSHLYGIGIEQTRHLFPVYVPESHPVITRLSRAYETITGEKAFMLRMGAGTYARKLRNNGVAFGAGLPGGVDTRVHQADEFIYIEDMMRHAEICLQGMYELLVD
jgi:succinyl-diaminopimelate desuccinylase